MILLRLFLIAMHVRLIFEFPGIHLDVQWNSRHARKIQRELQFLRDICPFPRHWATLYHSGICLSDRVPPFRVIEKLDRVSRVDSKIGGCPYSVLVLRDLAVFSYSHSRIRDTKRGRGMKSHEAPVVAKNSNRNSVAWWNK